MKGTIAAADLFCGGGGTSTGLARACARTGRKLDLVAVNHWELAIETHRRNHPEARHVCSSLDGLNPRDLVPSGRLKILVASPECTHHSAARGGRPMNDQSRASAWLILKWLQELYVENLLIENVPEFEQWGPLGADGKPLKSKRGVLFAQFIENLKALGYAVDYKVLNAANYGDPTTRQRLFVIGRRGGRKPTWPEITHARPGRTETLYGAVKPWRAAREIIDWSIPGKSIFGRKKPLAMNTLKRILAGMEKFRWPEPFIVVLRQHVAARSVDQPLPTVPMNRLKDRLRSVGEPVQTVTASSADIGLVEPFLVPNFGEATGQAPRVHSLEGPLPAVTSHGAGCLVEPFIATVSHGDNGGRRVHSLSDPLPTATGSNDHAVIEPFIQPFDNKGWGSRARNIDRPLPTVTTKNGLGLVVAQPCIIEMRSGKTANSIADPLSTVTTSGAHHGVLQAFPEASPFLDKFYGSGVPASIDEPLDTVTAKARFGLCQVGEAIYDIRFRMLRPRELARAQGFPDSYEFAGGSADVTKLIGNAVPVGLAEALCAELIA